MPGIKKFEIDENEETGEITATIEARIEHVLIWMNSSDYNNSDCNYKYFEEGIQRSSRYTTFETARNTHYTICAARMISQEEITVPLPNCRAYTTLASPEDRPWLLIKDKNIALAIFCFVLLLTVIISGAIVYKVVLRNPKLLRINKTVIIVRPYKCEVKFGKRVGNDTPRSSLTTASSVSSGGASYLTIIETTSEEEITWQFRQMRDKLRDCKTETALVFSHQQEPPPLPVYRLSYTSDTSSYIEWNSETSYMTINEPRTVPVIDRMLNHMSDELTDNCITECAKESHC